MTRRSKLMSRSCSAAAYGRACAACSQAKTKCYYLSDGSGCERCHRRGKSCEPATSVRKRKADTSPTRRQSRLEEKLDDLVTILTSQAVGQQAQMSVSTPQTTTSTPSASSMTSCSTERSMSLSAISASNLDVVIDTASSAIRLYPVSSKDALFVIANDVSTHKIPTKVADGQLNTFRSAFIPIFPLVHIPDGMSASELRDQRPFLWLVIMCLSTKQISQQFILEESIWRIISQRVVVEHQANLDLLLGILCFASWSHHFKQDKPFMTMLSQIATSLAVDIGLNNDNRKSMPRQKELDSISAERATRPSSRTMDERRSTLSLYHLMSSTWSAYRNIEPPRWTSYMEECLRIIEEEGVTDMDILLTTQVKCHLICNTLSGPGALETGDDPSSAALSHVLISALLQRLEDIQKQLPPRVRSHKIIRFYLYSSKLRIQDCALKTPIAKDQTGMMQLRRIRDLDSALVTIESLHSVFNEMALDDWVGMNVDVFAQFTHFLVVLFKLTVLEEPQWDLNEVRRRVDLFDVLDQSCDKLQRLPAAVGMIDADGPRRGLFFKATGLLKTIKALFLREMPTHMHPVTTSPDDASEYTNIDDPLGYESISDEFLSNLANEPWLFDIFDYPYSLDTASSQSRAS